MEIRFSHRYKSNYAVVFNLPSFDKFEPLVQSRGTMFVDSTLVNKISWRDDISGYYIPATKLAEDNDLPGRSKCNHARKSSRSNGLFTRDEFLESMRASIPASKPNLWKTT